MFYYNPRYQPQVKVVLTAANFYQLLYNSYSRIQDGGFPGGAVVKNPPANAGDTGSIPGPGRSHMAWGN